MVDLKPARPAKPCEDQLKEKDAEIACLLAGHRLPSQRLPSCRITRMGHGVRDPEDQGSGP